MADERYLSIQDVINGLGDPLERLGFDRERLGLATVSADRPPGGVAASWSRLRTAEDPRSTGDWERLERHGVTDSVGVHLDDHLTVMVAGIFVRLEWRRTVLDPDEFGISVEAWISNIDRFAPALR